MRPRWYWTWQDYGPPRYVPVRLWHLVLIAAALAYLGMAVWVILRAGE